VTGQEIERLVKQLTVEEQDGQGQINHGTADAQAAIAFEQRRTGRPHAPSSVTVVLSEGTLVITLHEALSPAEKELARTPAGAAQVQGVSPTVVCQLLRLAAAGDQTGSPGCKYAKRLRRSSQRAAAVV